MRSLTKKTKPQTENFCFITDLKFHYRLAESSEGLNSSLAQSTSDLELVSGVKIAARVWFQSMIYSSTYSKHVNKNNNQGSHAILKVLKKYWISKLVFKTLKRYWIWPKCILCIEKVLKFQMEKKSEVSGQNFTESKAIHYLFSVDQCVKLSFMIKNFEKWREVMGLNFLNLVLKRYWKRRKKIFLNVWEPWIMQHIAYPCSHLVIAAGMFPKLLSNC